jgi:anthranilate synthase component 1
MTLSPDFYHFSHALDAGTPQLVWMKIHADLETPVSASLKLLGHDAMGFLLESVVGGEVRGRYSVIGLEPDLLWRCEGNQAFVALSDGKGGFGDFVPQSEPALQNLQAQIDASALAIPPELPPMASALVGYLGYETVALIERLPEPKADSLGIPDGFFMRPSLMAIFDAVAGDIFLVTAARPRKGITAEQLYHEARQRVESATAKLKAPLPAPASAAASGLDFTSNTTRAEYYGMVEKAKTHIRAGDIFQVVPSQRFSSLFTLPAFALYRSLRHMNPSPFLFYLNMGAFQIVGSSPEILVRLRDNVVTVRPIAGTRPRGKTRDEDQQLAEDLRADPKEIAEHLMLLDLGRNDVGRVATAGSVKVTEHMLTERYSHVMHLVSNVEGQLQPGKNALDALMAGFPAGTVSGAPKIRAMEIIHALEPVPRKFYAGGVGYFSANGSMDICIALRTALIKDGTLTLQAGGGVVADSVPDAEYEESCNKAKALMRAAEEAGACV